METDVSYIDLLIVHDHMHLTLGKWAWLEYQLRVLTSTVGPQLSEPSVI